jgi:regulation of enolase protein 1 (concanavalin A-like superfamily)
VSVVVAIAGIPHELDWVVAPVAWRLEDDGATLAVEAGPRTDLFVSPADGTRHDNAPRLLTTIDGDFQLGAMVQVAFAVQFDAAVLLLWESHDYWAKLCFERSPEGRPTIVSVVNRGVSDDANGWPVDGDSAWLRVCRIGRAYALHASTDGERWDLARVFTMDGTGPVRVGFEAQSPHGPGCRVRFGNIRFSPIPPADLRDGS